jgi:hypothetical protein
MNSMGANYYKLRQPGYQMNSFITKCCIPRQDGFNMIAVRTRYCNLSQSEYKMDSIIAKHDNPCQQYCQGMWFLSWSIKLLNQGSLIIISTIFHNDLICQNVRVITVHVIYSVCCNHHHVLSSCMIDHLFSLGFVLFDLWYSM